jgi:hypothetical protein
MVKWRSLDENTKLCHSQWQNGGRISRMPALGGARWVTTEVTSDNPVPPSTGWSDVLLVRHRIIDTGETYSLLMTSQAMLFAILCMYSSRSVIKGVPCSGHLKRVR